MADRLRERKRQRPAGAVFAGMAITVLGRCALVTGMRELTPAEGFPTLPKIDLLLYKAPGVTSPAVDALHDYLAHYVGLSSSSINGKRF